MLSAIAIIPSAPVMVPELAADAADELAGLRQAAFAAAGVAAGDGGSPSVSGRRRGASGPTAVGTFAGYGVDVRVSTVARRRRPTDAELPLCALIAGWVRGQAKPEAACEVRVYAADHDADAALARGRRLRAEIDEAADPPACWSSPTARTR